MLISTLIIEKLKQNFAALMLICSRKVHKCEYNQALVCVTVSAFIPSQYTVSASVECLSSAYQDEYAALCKLLTRGVYRLCTKPSVSLFGDLTKPLGDLLAILSDQR